jgi:cell division septum initiation protein DivIVA
MANTSNRGDALTGQAREQADAAKGHLQQAGSEARQAVSSAASGVAQKAQDTASNLAERAKDAASNVGQRASDVAHRVEDKTDDALSSVGQRMSTMAGTLRQSAPRSGVVGSAAGAVADRLDSSGRYLQEHGVSDITDDLSGLIRRNPLPSLCVAFGVGFLIGMAASRR